MNSVRSASSVPDATTRQPLVRQRPRRGRRSEDEPDTATVLRLSALLTWSHVRAGRVGEVLQWTHRGASGAGRILTGRGRPPRTGRLDPLIDVTAPDVEFASLDVVGVRPLLRSTRAAPAVRLTLNGAYLVRGGTRRPLPLQDLWLDGADPVPGRLSPRKAPDTLWDAVISGADTALQVRGPWLHLAALGMLAGWAEPA